MDRIYINKTFIYSKSNIAGFELLNKNDKSFRRLLHYEEAINYIISLGGRIENAEVYIKNKTYLGKEVYDIRAYGNDLKSILDKSIIFNLNVLYNERSKFYKEYSEIFNKFICVISF